MEQQLLAQEHAESQRALVELWAKFNQQAMHKIKKGVLIWKINEKATTPLVKLVEG